eukprot:m.77395 g.77395  ORF g.77395 m.77395 type:complete len:75 (+) comp36027_c0_seq1:107-331(+)
MLGRRCKSQDFIFLHSTTIVALDESINQKSAKDCIRRPGQEKYFEQERFNSNCDVIFLLPESSIFVLPFKVIYF